MGLAASRPGTGHEACQVHCRVSAPRGLRVAGSQCPTALPCARQKPLARSGCSVRLTVISLDSLSSPHANASCKPECECNMDATLFSLTLESDAWTLGRYAPVRASQLLGAQPNLAGAEVPVGAPQLRARALRCDGRSTRAPRHARHTRDTRGGAFVAEEPRGRPCWRRSLGVAACHSDPGSCTRLRRHH